MTTQRIRAMPSDADSDRQNEYNDRASISTAEKKSDASLLQPELALIDDYQNKYSIGPGRPTPPLLPTREAWRVDFELDDPLCAKNWPYKKKVVTGLAVGYTAMVCGCGSSIFSSATDGISKDFGVSIELANLGTSLFICGFASGPILWGPMSEVYGRKPAVMLATFGGTIFNIAAGTGKDFQTVMICRFFAGFISAAPVSVGGGAFSDMFDTVARGVAMVLFTSSIFIFPILAPIIGSLISHAAGHSDWRFVQYLIGLMGVLALVVDWVWMSESFAPVLLARKARQLRHQTGNWGLYAPHEDFEFQLKPIVTKTVARPLRMLFCEPILLLVSMYSSFIYGMFYLYLSMNPIVFHTGYGMGRVESTLPYLGLAAGMVIGVVLIIYVFEPRYRALKTPGPKDRLPPSIYGGLIFPCGIFWLVWTGNFPDKIHWMVPASSGLLTGAGMILILIPCTNYVVDIYAPLAASALAANACLRSGVGAVLSMFGCYMFLNLGTGIAGSIVGGISAVMLPVPVVFYKFDSFIRSKSRYAVQ